MSYPVLSYVLVTIETYCYYYLFSFLNLLLYDSIYNCNRC